MELNPESSRSRKNPTPADIEDVLNGLGTTDEFVTLNDELGFIQVAGSVEQGGLVEYGDGDRSLFRATDEEVPIAKVIGLFKKYLDGDPSWHSELEWVDASEEMAPSKKPVQYTESDDEKKMRAMKAYYHAATGDVNNRFGRSKGCTGALLVALLALASLAAALLSL